MTGPLEPPQGGAALDWRAALARGDFRGAHRLYLATGAPDPDTVRLLDALADLEAHVRAKAWSMAERRLERIEERPPLLDWGELERELAALKESADDLEKGRVEEALAALEARAWSAFPAEAEVQRGTAHIYLGQPERAEQAFARALDLDERHPRALTNLGNVALERGEVDEAIERYQAAIAADDDFPNAHHNLGVAYRRKGQIGRSVRSLRRAQQAAQRRDREAARSAVGRARPALPRGRWGRWALYALGAVGLYLLLQGRGLF